MFTDEAGILMAAAILAATRDAKADDRRPGMIVGLRSANPVDRLRAVLQDMCDKKLIPPELLQED